MVSKGRSSSKQITEQLRKLASLLLASGICLTLAYVKSASNPADAPSRKLGKAVKGGKVREEGGRREEEEGGGGRREEEGRRRRREKKRSGMIIKNRTFTGGEEKSSPKRGPERC